MTATPAERTCWRELLSRAAEGNSAASEQVYAQFRKAVRPTIIRIVGVNNWEDACQEAFLNFWRALVAGRIRVVESPGRYILRCARNRSLEILRSRANHPEFANPSTIATQNDETTDFLFDRCISIETRDPERHLLAKEKLERALAAVKGVELEVVSRLDAPITSIASELRCPANTVKTRRKRAIAKMRAAIDGALAVRAA